MKKVSEVICGRNLANRVKGKVYNTVVRSAILYGLETVAVTRKQEAEIL